MRSVYVGVLVFAVFVLAAEAQVEIELVEGVSTRGQECTVVIARDGRPLHDVPVSVTYNPKSKAPWKEMLGRTNQRGKIRWTPQETGIATITVFSGEREYHPAASIYVTEAGKSASDVPVAVTYNPGTPFEEVQEIGKTDKRGLVKWDAILDNVVNIKAGKRNVLATKNFAVRFEAFPLSGLIIFLLAGCLLYGGIVLAFFRMRREWGVISSGEELQNDE